MIEEGIVASSLSPLGGFMSWFMQGETDCIQLLLCNSEMSWYLYAHLYEHLLLRLLHTFSLMVVFNAITLFYLFYTSEGIPCFIYIGFIVTFSAKP